MSNDNIDYATHSKEDNPLPVGPITIDAVYLSVPSPLLDCYFLPEGPKEYSLFGPGEKPGGKPLRSKIKSGETFDIELGGQTWRLTVHFHMDNATLEEKAHGTWSPVSGGMEDGGTYTAQAGGGSGLPTGKSASA